MEACCDCLLCSLQTIIVMTTPQRVPSSHHRAYQTLYTSFSTSALLTF